MLGGNISQVWMATSMIDRLFFGQVSSLAHRYTVVFPILARFLSILAHWQ